MELPRHGLVLFTWGNVSAIDRELGVIVIKPSGVPYHNLTAESMVLLDLNGKPLEKGLKPSSDTLTHVELYRLFECIGGISHTHSSYATAMSQAGTAIQPFGTTHADYFYGEIPCTRALTDEEIEENYELNSARVMAKTFASRKLQTDEVPGILLKHHGPFAWGRNALEAVYHAIIMEELAKTSYITKQLNPHVPIIKDVLMDKHYLRRHGEHAYYGQGES